MSSTIDFIHDTAFDVLPPVIVSEAIRCLTDTLGVAAGGSRTQLSRIIRNHAARQFGGGRAAIWWDGRDASPAGAALANAMTIDALDAHDGHKLTKGHVGCGVIPALIALMQQEGRTCPHELLTSVVIGYEIGTRAGIALHASAADYHTSGAWIALAAAALGARQLGLTAAQTREALGIAEYHGPRSQMMRCIDHPTMVKDGSGWGAMAGVSAAYLAADGFTGAPAISMEDAALAHLWCDLGDTWRIREQYIKLYPVCRWAQPAVEAVLGAQAGARASRRKMLRPSPSARFTRPGAWRPFPKTPNRRNTRCRFRWPQHWCAVRWAWTRWPAAACMTPRSGAWRRWSRSRRQTSSMQRFRPAASPVPP
jgi:2-methylcitrate dehydratase PrpD